jgi:WW domain-containing oxidoreductase
MKLPFALFGRAVTKTPAQGAATTCYLATRPELEGVSGRYYSDCHEETPRRDALDTALAQRLWQTSEDLVRPYLG